VGNSSARVLFVGSSLRLNLLLLLTVGWWTWSIWFVSKTTRR